jgi:XRE family transcriptional regulator of biofilm formation
MPVNLMPREQSIQRFGEKLRALRMHHGLTLKELASKLGYSAHGYISELETGTKTPTVEFVLKVAALFKVTTDQLLKDDLELDLINDKD